MYRSRRPRRGLRPAARPWVPFAILTAVSLLLLLASGTQPVRTAQRAANDALDPMRTVVADAARTVADAVGAIGDLQRLRAENGELRSELAAAEQRVVELTEAGRENEELRDLLGIARALDMELLPARITSREPSNFAWEAALDAGTDDGVRIGMPVVGSADGGAALVGTITDAGATTARVRFLVDTRSIVIGRDQQSRALGEIRGQAGGQLLFTNVPLGETLTVGDTVLSAGLTVADDSSRYPGGLLIGRIQAVEPDENAVTQTGFVVPAMAPDDLERVLIVLDFEQG